MMSKFGTTALALLLASTALDGSLLNAASAASSSTAWRKIAPWIPSATREGDVEDSKQVTIAAYLSLRNRDALHALITAQSTPGSGRYGQYLTPAQFHAQFSPLPADVARVEATLKSLGFTIGQVPASGLFVEATGSIAAVKSAFKVSQHYYAFKGHILRATSDAPTIPAAISDVVTYIGGLDDSQRLLTPHHVRPGEDAGPAISVSALSRAEVSPNAPPPVAASTESPYCSSYFGDHQATLSSAPGPYPAKEPWLVCGYTPAQIRQAYGINKVAVDGLFTRVGIVDNYASPTIVYDVNRYSSIYGLPQLNPLNFKQVVPAGLYDVPANDPCGPQGWYTEETLDVEAVHSVAPRAFIVFAGQSCYDPGNTGLYNLIDNHSVDVITNSYGFGGESLPADFLTTEEQYFEQAAAEGISVLFSSGDDGDLIASNGVASGSWEATSPYVTAVGGTSLALYDSAGDKAEWGWGDYRAFLAQANVASSTSVTTTGLAGALAFYSGSGGGPSLIWEQPSYQALTVPAAFSGTTTLADGSTENLPYAPDRVTPDISMVGDPYTGFLIGETYTTSGNAVYDAPCKPITATTEYCLTGIGGTSLSSPLFAGVLSLTNEARLLALKPPVGFINPALYNFVVGHPGSTTTPIADVQPPATPTALLRGYLGNPSEIRLVTMNSTLDATGKKVVEGNDSSYLTGAGYDEVTGLGTPYVPAFIPAFTALK